ncbi:MAG: PAS domain S-box protein [Bacteroidetes bacterium]|nr:PAS domain S-box protein [Bacteroidota bacterium]
MGEIPFLYVYGINYKKLPFMVKQELKYSLIIGGNYLLFGILWILLSDSFLDFIASDSLQYKHLQSIKGVLFVCLSALLIFLLVLFYYKRVIRYQNKFIARYKENELMFHEFPIGIAVVGLDNKIIRGNHSLAKILGYTETEILNLTRFDITLPEEHTMDTSRREEMLGGDSDFYTRNRQLIRKNGEKIWCKITVILLKGSSGKPKYFIVSVQDINQEVMLNSQLAEMNAGLLKAQSIGRFGHWTMNINSRDITWSEETYRILGIETSQEKGLMYRFYSLLDRRHRKLFDKSLNALIHHGKKLNIILPVNLTESAEIKYVNLEAEIVRDANARGNSYLQGTIKDITEIMLLQNEKKDFERSLIQWGYLLSHELRKPLCSILGLMNLYNNTHKSIREKEELVEKMRELGEEMDGYTRKLAGELYKMETTLNKGKNAA